ncbi:MAG: hypothetical protein V2I67_07485 [Thermoanaerobaculales bacterium]|jgi:hypothetical protein|nr:hypothetical protein [Thermoanaerobaculales bacterium]
MSESSKKWFRGCGAGCLVMIVVAVLGTALLVFSMRSAFVDAAYHREKLDRRFGSAAAFTPAADGSVPEDRVEVFLSVRSALEPVVADVVKIDGEMGEFEKLAEEEDPPLRVALPAIARLSRSMLSMPRVFGAMEEARNAALADAGMGLGEYIYNYVMAYHQELLQPSHAVHLFGGSAVNGRVRDDLRGMMRRQLKVAEGAGEADSEWTGLLAAEVAALDADPERIPWQGGLPTAVARSFESFRGDLDAVYWPATAELDLLNSTVTHGGLQIVMD